MQKSVIKKQ